MADKSTKADNLNVGLPGDGKPDEVGRRIARDKLEPRVSPLVGNIADLQRMGADAAAEGVKDDSAIQFPPGTDDDEVMHPAEIDARRGDVTAETERSGEAKGFREEQAKADEERIAEASDPKATSHVVDGPHGSVVVRDAGDTPAKSGDAAAKADAKAKEGK